MAMTSSDPDHFCLLFVSTLAAGTPADVVTGITSQARVNNGRSGITGLLVFDGEDFAQLMEGDEQVVRSVSDRMMSDPRHDRMEVVYAQNVSTPRRFPTWRLGYLVLNLMEFGPHSLRGMRGRPALESFNFMLPALDIAMGNAVPARLAKSRP